MEISTVWSCFNLLLQQLKTISWNDFTVVINLWKICQFGKIYETDGTLTKRARSYPTLPNQLQEGNAKIKVDIGLKHCFKWWIETHSSSVPAWNTRSRGSAGVNPNCQRVHPGRGTSSSQDHTETNNQWSFDLTCIFLDCGRKPENPAVSWSTISICAKKSETWLCRPVCVWYCGFELKAAHLHWRAPAPPPAHHI